MDPINIYGPEGEASGPIMNVSMQQTKVINENGRSTHAVWIAVPMVGAIFGFTPDVARDLAAALLKAATETDMANAKLHGVN